jgi:hypothetical protein
MAELKRYNSRHEVFKSALRSAGILGSDGVPRPPGAISEKTFVKACVRCVTSVESSEDKALKYLINKLKIRRI